MNRNVKSNLATGASSATGAAIGVMAGRSISQLQAAGYPEIQDLSEPADAIVCDYGEEITDEDNPTPSLQTTVDTTADDNALFAQDNSFLPDYVNDANITEYMA